MKVTLLVPQPTEHIPFTLRFAKRLPQSAGCYALTNFQGEILYVGLSVDLLQRFKQHRDTEEKRQPTSLGRAYWFYFTTASENNINSIERGWLYQHSSVHGTLPVLNKIASPVR